MTPLAEQPGLVEAVKSGLTIRELADQFNVSTHTIRTTCRKLGLRINGRRVYRTPRPLDLTHAVEICELRKTGKSYQAIGKQFGIRKQEVARILQATQPDLCGRDRWLRKCDDPAHQKLCPQCGKPVPFESRKIQKRCSVECWSDWCRAHPSEVLLTKSQHIIKRRLEGTTWQKIADEIGFPNAAQPQMMISRYAEITGADISGTKGFRGDRRK